MSLTKNNLYVKPEATQNARIAPGSPLALIGLFVELIRKRFNTTSGLPWIYDSDIKKTKIAIESAFTENAEHRNFSPAIFVDKDDSVIGRSVVGDRVGTTLTDQRDVFWGLMSVPILIECIASTRGESATIGDIVQLYLHASSDLIQSKFMLHELTPITLQKTQPFDRDKKTWVSAITFTVQFPVRWSQTPIQPLLQEIEFELNHSGAISATEFFEQVVLGITDEDE